MTDISLVQQKRNEVTMNDIELPDILTNKIDVLFESKRYVEVIDYVHFIESQFVDSIDNVQLSALEVIKGFSQLCQGNLDDARMSFEDALTLDPQSSQACVGLGEIFYLRGIDAKALLMYEWAVTLDDANIGALRGLQKVQAAIDAVAGVNA